MPRCIASRRSRPQDAEASVGCFDIQLRASHAEATACLLPLLLCGEESASIVFSSLRVTTLPLPTLALQAVAHDEQQHECWLRELANALATTLSTPTSTTPMQREARRFFVQLQHRNAGVQFARIAALDSAVCLILSELHKAERPLGQEPLFRDTLQRIHRDEARHVAVTRDYTKMLVARSTAMETAEAVRISLVQLLETGAAAFETLQVDSQRLFKRLLHLPHGLFL
jgi:hypothetical protein